MNKRFSTLLATALVAGSLSASATALLGAGTVAKGNSNAGAKDATFIPGEYYYLKGAKAGVTGGVEYLTYLKGQVTTDSLAVVDDADLTTSEATDRALWKVVEVKNPATGALSHWTFENKYTGTLLSDGSVNAFEWLAEGVPADGSGTAADVAATILKSTQGLDLTKGEHYEFRRVYTVKEKVVGAVATQLTVANVLDGAAGATTNNVSEAIVLVKYDKDNKVVGAIDLATAVTADKTVSGIIEASATSATITGAVSTGKKVTVAAGTKIVLNVGNANDGLTVQPFVPDYTMALTATAGSTAGSLANVIAPKKFTSFKFTGLEASGTNVLAANEFEYVQLTVKGYSSTTNVGDNQSTTTIDVLRAKAKDAQGRALYLRMDTAKFAGGDYYKVKLDTLSKDGGDIIAAPKAVIQSYAFGIAYDYAADSVSIYPKFTLDKAADPASWSDSSTVTVAANTAAGNVLAIKQFSTAKELTLVPVAEVSKTAKYTFGDITPGGGVATFEDGVSYYIQRANKAENIANGKFYANNFYGAAQYMDSAYYLPATQWTVKEITTGHYTVKNRETGATLTGVDGTDGSIFYTGEGDAVAVAAADTLLFIKVPAQANDKYLGYLNLKEEDYRNKAYSISFTDYNGITTFVNTADSVLRASDEGVYFKLSPVPVIEKGFGADTLVRSAYYISDREGKKFITYNDAQTGYKLSETATPVKFLFRNVGANTYSLIDSVVSLPASKELIIDIKSGAVRPVAVGSAVTNNAFDILVEAAPEYVLDAKGHYNIENMRGDMLAADAQGFGMFRKEGELKAAYEKADFALFVDTAKIDKIEPSYFILSGAKAEKGTSKLEGNFLRVMSDSANVEGYKADNGLIRLAFVPAKREATSDSLLVNFESAKVDSVGYAKTTSKGKVSQFQFKIQYTNTDGEYLVENAAGYLATYNDVLCLTANKAAAQLIKLTSVEAPTANEGVEVSEVKVIAGNGAIQIVGAQGKKVVVSNILGQTIANTVISSDNATIAAPAGVVVVAVEGEEAVKAIVK
ncbi:hypothetical protein H8784_16245 [Parabacteroides acidifaciens]|uniref:DUF6383 domain-containing protein n=1 Tax=Parabacteroides acidifaciens TaxID=2290935 RepID=A0ABR7P4X4_9BACT|nr:DUF6383 domain-containing protein [Parabacteroides acidifaciens]MBC8603264.1 hypothetical protein [Parabacteroides acidifaciens]